MPSVILVKVACASTVHGATASKSQQAKMRVFMVIQLVEDFWMLPGYVTSRHDLESASLGEAAENSPRLEPWVP